MKQNATLKALWLALALSAVQLTIAQDNIILQGFYWNTVPGDLTDVANGGVWWDTIALVAPQLKNAGFNVLWTPPAQKGFAGKYDMGYGISDYYDYGQFNQFGTVRTRHGNLAQLQNAITTLKTNNIKVMADLVLNHRAGASSQQLEDCDIVGDGRGRGLYYTNFTPASARIAMDSSNFHPTQIHCDLNAEYHNRSFFEDICYFNNINNILNPNAANNGWYFGPHNLGAAGDSLIVVGRHMVDTMGFDMVRLDAVKHIDPGFLAPFLVELKNGTQPYAVGELFDGNVNTLRNYQVDVENFVSTYGTGSKNANMAVFDFSLRYALRDMCNAGGSYDMANLNNAGLRFTVAPLAAEDIVTFVENHDVDRIGFSEVTCPGGVLQIGNTCLEFNTDSGHDPITSNKYMAYAYIMGAEGNPTVFWKDWFWYGLEDEIKWLIALRKQFAKGGSTPMSLLAPSGGSFTTADYFIMRRNGLSSGVSDGAMVGLNDNASINQETFVNTAFSLKYLKDYSDGFMFVTEYAPLDSRTLIRTAKLDYSWWAPTGLYPKPEGVAASHFSMDATPGGCPHYITLKVNDAANFIINGSSIQPGDEIAVKNAAGQVVGIGRIGQGFKWDGIHDMLIEVLGSPSTNGMANGEAFRLFIYDASASMQFEAAVLQFSPTSTAFNFSPDRPNTPNRNGNFSTFSVSTSATNTFSCSSISRIIAFNTANVQTQNVCGADNASNAAYSDGWQNGDNGGTNFGAWTLSTTNDSNAGRFRGSSADNGDGNGDINTSNVALGMYANNGATSNAVRPFLSTLIPGTVFSLKMDNGYIESGGSVGFGLQNASGENLLEFYFRNGQANYKYNDNSGEQDTGLGFTDDGLTIQITLLTATTYQLAVTRNGGGNFVTTGTLKNPAGGQSIAQFRLFNANAGPDSPRNAYFNNFSVCYPATLLINEVDYDQGVTDNAEFIEIKNVSNNTINLDNYNVELVDASGTIYQTINLPNVDLTTNDYYVICASSSNTANCDLDISPDTDLIQDGTPAGIRIRLGSLTIDALSYEGDASGATEGTGIGLTDDGTATQLGLSRIADGNDNNANATDFRLTCISPGTANIDNTNSDADLYPNNCDNCPAIANDNQLDTDGDGLGDVCDACPNGNPAGNITNNGPICVGGSVQLTFTATNGVGSFTIVVNGITYNNVMSGITFTTLSPVTTTSYVLTAITDANNCQATGLNVSTTVTVNGDRGDLPNTWPQAHACVGTVWAGMLVDAETAQQFSANADGDDVNNLNDDDGLTNLPNPLQRDQSNNVSIILTSSIVNMPMYYGLWFDWNNDGTFEDFYGNPTALVPMGFTTTAVQTIFVPLNASVNYKVRLIVSAIGPLNISMAGGTFSNGEIEDYSMPTPLPIELLDFWAYEINSAQVQLKWTTASEKNNAYFSVQRSRNGQHWSEIGQIKGQGNSVQMQSYDYRDKKPFTGINYYRLQQFDWDGQSSVSPIRVVEVHSKKLSVKLYPNPAKEQVNLQLEGIGNRNYILKMYNVLGQEILFISDIIQNGEEYNISTAFLNMGTYFIRISNENGEVLEVLTFQKQ